MHFLAKTLGGVTVEELGSRMMADELTDWLAWFDLETEKRTLGDLATTVDHDLTLARLA